MDPKRLLSLNFLLFLSLAFELSYGTGESLLNCPEIPGQLGSSVLLSLASGGISKSMNKSVHVLVTRAELPGNSVKKKIASLDLPEGGSPRYLENGYTFHLENLSLGILESRKENEGWYFMTLEENFSVRHFCLQLKLYELVSTPEIKVLNLTQGDGNCSLTLACDVEKGDYVVYNWSEEVATDPLTPDNNSTHLLHLNLGPQNVNNVYVCTVSNPISSRSQTFTPKSQCWSESLGKANQYQPTMEAKSLTIYAQVQKSGSVQKKPDPLPAQDPCTTIYVAAAEPVPDPVQESNSITVYTRVTLPES
ncbi:signaling lymphocytic activation molecule isoform X2 [Enhydra lutris kenyoni]|uniref:Signaling lymphocytic activation molecule isoform X2 n=1 Tax=Enhydra lutris kenyoni TaxID=391180 RepID=A0A2Y9IGW5_ENHLU|nr:signaling lymphocytic activation molecule isoform X2 [Enhydra lutris kenyoni]